MPSRAACQGKVLPFAASPPPLAAPCSALPPLAVPGGGRGAIEGACAPCAGHFPACAWRRWGSPLKVQMPMPAKQQDVGLWTSLQGRHSQIRHTSKTEVSLSVSASVSTGLVLNDCFCTLHGRGQKEERHGLTCVPTTRTVTGVRSGSSETRSVLPLATASTTAGNGLPLPADCSSASALNSALAQGNILVEL